MQQKAPLDPKSLLEKTAAETRGGRRFRWILGGGSGVAALMLILWFVFGGSTPIEYQTGVVTRGTITVTITATGTLEPEDKVDVGTEISGRIVEVLADFNDTVMKGQIIARLDTELLSARVVQARASLASAEANVEQALASEKEARLKRARARELRDRRTISQQEMDTAEAALARAVAAVGIAKAQVQLSQAQLKSAESDLAKADIRSPIDGIVLDRKIEVGQTVAASFQTPVLFTLASDLKRMELRVNVDEADIGAVAPEQTAKFTVDAYPGREFKARVLSVYNAPRTTQNVVTYEAILSVDNSGMLLKPGMTATADITTTVIENALSVPNGALRYTPASESARAKPERAANEGERVGRVWTNGASLEPHDVLIGATDGIRTQILDGDVSEGANVLVDVKRAGGTGQQ